MELISLLLVILALHGVGNAIPIDGSSSTCAPTRPHLKVIKTTTNPDGSVIDWIPIHSQVINGEIAGPPPLPVDTLSAPNQTTFQPWATLQADGAEKGPEGTVPILRPGSVSALNLNTTKGPPVDPEHPPGINADAVGDHWYASSAQGISNHGGSASFSIYPAWTQSNEDFSLLQTAVLRHNVPKPGDNSQRVMQTVEAGWYVPSIA